MKRHPALVPLSRQHHDVLALGVFIDRGLRGSPAAATVADLRDRALSLWELEIRGHFEVEERVVFPAARQMIEDPSLVDLLLADHAAVRGKFSELERCEPQAAMGLLLELRELLVAHTRREERELFEAVQRAMPEKALRGLGEDIEERLPAVCLSLGSAAVNKPERRAG